MFSLQKQEIIKERELSNAQISFDKVKADTEKILAESHEKVNLLKQRLEEETSRAALAKIKVTSALKLALSRRRELTDYQEAQDKLLVEIENLKKSTRQAEESKLQKELLRKLKSDCIEAESRQIHAEGILAEEIKCKLIQFGEIT